MVAISSTTTTTTTSRHYRHSPRFISRRPLTYLSFLIGGTLLTLYFCLQIQPTTRTTRQDHGSINKQQQTTSHESFQEPPTTTTSWTKVDKNPETFGTIPLTGSQRFGTSSTVYYPVVDLASIIDPDDVVIPMSKKEKQELWKEKKQANNLLSYPKPIIRMGTSALHKPEQRRHALLTRCGYKGGVPGGATVNQDRVFLIEENDSTTKTSPFRMMGLFDGHGPNGHQTSHYAALNMPHVLEKHLAMIGGKDDDDDETAIRAAITDTFLEIDSNCPEGDGGSGSTGILLYRSGSKLYIANTGDSFAFIASSASKDDQSTKIIYQTKPHKPSNQEERKRIELNGGTVIGAPPKSEDGSEEFDYSSRVIFDLPSGMTLGLAMSRSIGDHAATKVGVIPNPTIDVIDLETNNNNNKKQKQQLYAITVSDGLLDHLHAQEIAKHLAEAYYHDPSKPLLEAAEELILKASDYWRAMSSGEGGAYRDDISLAVATLL